MNVLHLRWSIVKLVFQILLPAEERRCSYASAKTRKGLLVLLKFSLVSVPEQSNGSARDRDRSSSVERRAEARLSTHLDPRHHRNILSFFLNIGAPLI